MDITQKDLVLEYFKAYPNRDISHNTAVPWLMEQYKDRTGKNFVDPHRAIRSLYDDGVLQKIEKGVYRYDPNYKSKPQHRIDIRFQYLKSANYRKVETAGLGRWKRHEFFKV